MNRQIIGNVGLFYASYRLSQRGFYALPTIRNSKGPDLIIYDNTSMIGIQVKAISKINDINLGKHIDETGNIQYWIIIFDCLSENPRSLIIPFKDIKAGVDACRFGVNSDKNLVVCDYPKEDTMINNFWINRKMINEESQYYEKWETIKSGANI